MSSINQGDHRREIWASDTALNGWLESGHHLDRIGGPFAHLVFGAVAYAGRRKEVLQQTGPQALVRHCS